MPFYTSFPWKENIIFNSLLHRRPFPEKLFRDQMRIVSSVISWKNCLFLFLKFQNVEKILMYNFASLVVNYVLCFNFIKVTVGR